jgi:subtilisin family serine protease
MSHHQYHRIRTSLAPFIRFSLVIACLSILASCEGGGGVVTPSRSTNGSSLLTATSSTYIKPYVLGNDITLSTGETVVLNEIILTGKEDISDDLISNFIIKQNWSIVGYNKYARLYQVSGDFGSESKLNAAIQIATESGLFEFASKNALLKKDTAQDFNDPLLSNNDFSWWLNDIKIESAIKLLPPNADGVKVGIADRPFRADHNDLTFLTIFRSDGTNAEFSSNCPKNRQGKYECADDHGMHVAGIIGSKHNNSVLGAGVAGDRASLVAAEVWTAADQVSAITVLMEQNVRIINLSQNDRLCSARADCVVTDVQLLEFKKKVAQKAKHIYAIAKNLDPMKKTLFVSSAGNMGEYSLDLPTARFQRQPADFNGLISSFVSGYFSDVIDSDIRSFFLNSSLVVGSYNSLRNVSSFSSLRLGEGISSAIHILAPGENIGSLAYIGDSNATKSDSGTSMATPMASGVAALVLQANPTLTASEVRNIILDNSDTIDGYRALNAEKAVRAALEAKNRCGSVTSPAITGQQGPSYNVPANQSFGVSTAPTPKAGFPYSSYQWETSEGVGNFTTTSNSANSLVLKNAGGASVTVRPVLADGTVCTGATSQITVQSPIPPLPTIARMTPGDAVAGEIRSFSITGANLPTASPLDVTFEGCSNIVFAPGYTANLHQFTCTPQSAGTIKAIIREQAGGDVLKQQDVVVSLAPSLNLLLGSTASDSCSIQYCLANIYGATNTVTDGDIATARNLGTYSGSFNIFLPSPKAISILRLLPSMSPNGIVSIEVQTNTDATGAMDSWTSHGIQSRGMADQTWFNITLTPNTTNIRVVKVIFHSSPSWVALYEVEGYAL